MCEVRVVQATVNLEAESGWELQKEEYYKLPFPPTPTKQVRKLKLRNALNLSKPKCKIFAFQKLGLQSKTLLYYFIHS